MVECSLDLMSLEVAMKISLVILLTIMLWPWPAPARAQVGSAELSPYEQQVYGDRLWQVPREAYQREYRSEEYQARPYIPPKEEASPGVPTLQRRSSESRPLRTGPSDSSLRPGRSQQRYQTRKSFENEQRKISERSRVRAPGKAEAPAWQRGRGQDK